MPKKIKNEAEKKIMPEKKKVPGRPFVKGDPRIYPKENFRKKTFQDVLNSVGAVVVKDKDGKEIDKFEGEDLLIKEIVNIGIKEKNPAMMKFIYQHMNMPQVDPELSAIKKQAERARAAKLEIANAKARGELISRDYIKKMFGEIYSVHRSIFLSGGPVISVSLAAKLGIKDDEKKMIINEDVDNHFYKTLSAIKRKINDFLTADGGEPLPEEPLPEKKKGRKK